MKELHFIFNPVDVPDLFVIIFGALTGDLLAAFDPVRGPSICLRRSALMDAPGRTEGRRDGLQEVTRNSKQTSLTSGICIRLLCCAWISIPAGPRAAWTGHPWAGWLQTSEEGTVLLHFYGSGFPLLHVSTQRSLMRVSFLFSLEILRIRQLNIREVQIEPNSSSRIVIGCMSAFASAV